MSTVSAGLGLVEMNQPAIQAAMCLVPTSPPPFHEAGTASLRNSIGSVGLSRRSRHSPRSTLAGRPRGFVISPPQKQRPRFVARSSLRSKHTDPLTEDCYTTCITTSLFLPSHTTYLPQLSLRFPFTIPHRSHRPQHRLKVSRRHLDHCRALSRTLPRCQMHAADTSIHVTTLYGQLLCVFRLSITKDIILDII